MPAKHAKDAKGEGKSQEPTAKRLWWKTEIRIEISCEDPDLVAEAAEGLEVVINKRTNRDIEAHPGSLLTFWIRTSAVIPEGMSFPKEAPRTR